MFDHMAAEYSPKFRSSSRQERYAITLLNFKALTAARHNGFVGVIYAGAFNAVFTQHGKKDAPATADIQDWRATAKSWNKPRLNMPDSLLASAKLIEADTGYLFHDGV